MLCRETPRERERDLLWYNLPYWSIYSREAILKRIPSLIVMRLLLSYFSFFFFFFFAQAGRRTWLLRCHSVAQSTKLTTGFLHTRLTCCCGKKWNQGWENQGVCFGWLYKTCCRRKRVNRAGTYWEGGTERRGLYGKTFLLSATGTHWLNA